MIDIKQDYFTLFDIEVSYCVDLNVLSERYRSLQKVAHPDKFSHLSDQERRLSVQYTAFINEAYSVLKSPLKRAQYMLLLKGIDTFAESSVSLDPQFLFEQMELRESLAEIDLSGDPEALLDSLQKQVSSSQKSLRAKFVEDFSSESYESAAVLIRKMQFFDKLSTEIDAAEDRLF